METRPPTLPEAKPDVDVGEWKNVTLRPAPPSMPERSFEKHVTLPIVPPRRKKAEKLIKSGGFREVFGSLARPPSCDSNLSTIKDLQLRRRNSSSDIPSDDERFGTSVVGKNSKIERKVSKVGNRKSDQFFGENLSDCLSDVPVVDVIAPINNAKEPKPEIAAIATHQPDKQTDEIDAFLLANANKLESIAMQKTANVAEKSNEEDTETANLNKKAEFLMAMLDEYNSEEMRYYGAAPVEEPVIVPKRKHGRHICDDHDKLKNALAASENHFHKHESDLHASVDNRSNAEAHTFNKPARKHSKKHSDHDHKHQHKLDAPRADAAVTPRKPDRDMDKYRNSKELQPPVRDTTIGRSLDAIKKDTEVESKTLTIPPFSQFNDVNGSAPIYDTEKLDTILKKCSSSQSFLTPDLMDQIVNKVYGFKMNWDDHDNVHNSGYDDCSGLVAPNSKLKTRKISVIRKDQLTEKPIVEEASEVDKANAQSERAQEECKSAESKGSENEKPLSNFSIGDVSIKLNESVADSKLLLTKDLECSGKDVVDTVSEAVKETRLESLVKDVAVKEMRLENGLNTGIPIEPIISTANIKAEVSAAVTSIQDIKDPTITLPIAIDADASKPAPRHVLKKSDTVLEIQHFTTPVDETSNILEEIYSKNRSVLSSFQTYFDEYPKKTTIAPDVGTQSVEASAPQSSSDESDAGTDANKQRLDRRGSIVDHDEWFREHSDDASPASYKALRRGSDVMTYDTNTVYPFGSREKTLSESSEFFDNKINLNKAESAPTTLVQSKAQSIDSTDDHSTLLKFLPSAK